MKYIASMTTYPKRFRHALEAIKSIENQTKKPKALVINISQEDWYKAELDFIHQAKFLFSNHLIIQPCINLKPANKIIPTAEKYGDNIIVTFDDDVIYPNNRVEKLLEKYKKYPDNPIVYRSRRVMFLKDRVLPYSTWPFNKITDKPNKNIFPTSVSGSLYPPTFFSKDFFDIDTYIKLSHNNDDIWTYFHVLLQESSFVAAGIEFIPPGVPGAQESALWKNNISSGGNDEIISKLEKKYGSLYSLTKEEND